MEQAKQQASNTAVVAGGAAAAATAGGFEAGAPWLPCETELSICRDAPREGVCWGTSISEGTGQIWEGELCSICTPIALGLDFTDLAKPGYKPRTNLPLLLSPRSPPRLF